MQRGLPLLLRAPRLALAGQLRPCVSVLSATAAGPSGLQPSARPALLQPRSGVETASPPRRWLRVSAGLGKAKGGKGKKGKGGGGGGPDLRAVTLVDGAAAAEELEGVLGRLEERLSAEISLRLDVRVFQALEVEVDGAKHPLGDLAELRLKSQSFLEAKCALAELVKPVKEALERSGMSLAPYAEGGSVLVPLPRMTRERRSDLAEKAAALAHQAADDVRKVFKRWDREVRTLKDSGDAPADDAEAALAALLAAQRHAVQRTKDLAQAKKEQLLKEQL